MTTQLVGSVTLRAATAVDVRPLARLHVLSQRVTYGPALPPGVVDGIDEESMYEKWDRRINERDHSAVLLAESPGAGLAGFGMINSASSQWSTVNSLHVHPDLHGCGLGRALLTALVDIADAWQRRHLQLYVLATNVNAHRFYEHLGWQRRGTAPDHAIAGHPVEILRYELR